MHTSPLRFLAQANFHRFIQYIIAASIISPALTIKLNYTTDGEECLGSCGWQNSDGVHQFQCITVSDLKTKACSPDSTKDYQGRACLSECGREISSPKCAKTPQSWCRILGNKRSYCSETFTDLQFQTIGALTGKPCISSCGSHNGTRYTWCRTGYGLTECEPCSFFPNYSFMMKPCRSACMKTTRTLRDGENPYICRDSTQKLNLCSPVFAAEEVDDVGRGKRERYPRHCQDLTTRHLSKHRTTVHFPGNSSNGSIREIFVLDDDQIPSSTPSVGNQNFLPFMTHSLIYQRNYNVSGAFPPLASNRQMVFMQQKYGDEKGHLVGKQFGGPAIIKNMVPMTCKINGPGGLYTLFERRLARELSRIPGSKLEHWVYVDYDFHSDLFHFRRPTNFTVCANHLDRDGQYLKTLQIYILNE